MRTALFTKLFGDRPVTEVADTTARLGFDGTGTCTLHPIRCSSTSIPASVYSAPNRCHASSAILASVQH